MTSVLGYFLVFVSRDIKHFIILTNTVMGKVLRFLPVKHRFKLELRKVGSTKS